jgi:hypothetical protein
MRRNQLQRASLRTRPGCLGYPLGEQEVLLALGMAVNSASG